MPGFFKQETIIPRVTMPESSINFNYQNQNHIEIITKRLTRFKQAQTILHNIDSNIIHGVTIGSAAWFVSWCLPLVTVSIAAFCFATHYASHRPEYFKQYQESLNDLIEAYKWCMGTQEQDHWHILGLKQTQELILTLGPCATKETIFLWNMNDLKPVNRLFAFTHKRDIEPSPSFKEKLALFANGNQTKIWQFTLYGENGTDDLIGTVRRNFNRWINKAVNNVTAQVVNQ